MQYGTDGLECKPWPNVLVVGVAAYAELFAKKVADFHLCKQITMVKVLNISFFHSSKGVSIAYVCSLITYSFD